MNWGLKLAANDMKTKVVGSVCGFIELNQIRCRKIILAMATKYDTNPLDPDFPEKARAAAAGDAEIETQTLPYKGGETRRFPEAAQTEEQTRKFAPDDVSAYSAPYSPPFNGQYVPTNYQPYGFANADQSISRKVERIGLPENILTALPYIPWYIGMIAGLLVLFLVPKSETKVRFHAAQGLAAHIGILIITTILGVIANFTGVAQAGNVIFQIVTTVMLVIFAIKAWQGKPIHIESIDGLTNWLEEKITPKA
jgi:uncharacterized membrane protein